MSAVGRAGLGPAPASRRWRMRRTDVDLVDLRIAGGLMLAAAVVHPFIGGGDVGLPCPLRSLTGVPCPLCGMTTSVTATVQLRLGDALAANPAGVLAVIVAIVLLVHRRPRQLAVPTLLLPAGLAILWIFELARFGFLVGAGFA